MIDGFALIPMLACIYAAIAFHLIIATCSATDSACLLAPRPESKIFWPAMAVIAVFMAVRNFSRLHMPPQIVCLFGYLALAGMSVVWAFNPQLSFIRFAQQAMIITSIVLPAMLASRNVDMVRGLFVCFTVGALLNLFFVFGRPPIDVKFATWGYPGYFAGKNYLGEFAAVALLLAIHEMLHPGMRRVMGIGVAVMAVFLLGMSNSKTAMGLAVAAPLLAYVTLVISRKTRLSPALILLSIPFCYAVFSWATGITVNRISYMLYGDSTFTGRTIIWDFVHMEIAKKPILGWGYQSFWLAGPDAPSIRDAPGWVKTMPNAHNGYLDTLIETGYVGFFVLMAFIITTVHAVGRMSSRFPARAWIVLSIAIYIIVSNGFETIWLRGFEMLWVVFVILASEIARHWRPVMLPRRAVRPAGPRPGPAVPPPRAARRPPVPPHAGDTVPSPSPRKA